MRETRLSGIYKVARGVPREATKAQRQWLQSRLSSTELGYGIGYCRVSSFLHCSARWDRHGCYTVCHFTQARSIINAQHSTSSILSIQQVRQQSSCVITYVVIPPLGYLAKVGTPSTVIAYVTSWADIAKYVHH